MSRFASIARSERRLETSTYTIYGLKNMQPALTLRPATDANDKYFNAALKRQRQGRGGRGPRMAAATLKQWRDHDRELYPQHVVTGWSGVVDDDGKEVAFSKEACAELFEQLPDDILDDIRNYASDPASFLEDEDPDDVAAQAGN